MIDTGRSVLRGAGAEIVEEQSSLDLLSTTLALGTCRMGDDPRTSVADGDGVCHEVPNLAFADASLMPSGGTGVAPSLTISAVASRMADRLLALP